MPQLSSQSVHSAHGVYFKDDGVLWKHSAHFSHMAEFAATVSAQCTECILYGLRCAAKAQQTLFTHGRVCRHSAVRFRCVPPGKIRCSRVNLNNFGSFGGTACFYSGDDRSRHDAQSQDENILWFENSSKKELVQKVCLQSYLQAATW